MSANKVFGSKYRAVKKRISSRRMDSHARCARAKRALSSGGSTLFLYLHLFSFSFSFFLNNEKKKKEYSKKGMLTVSFCDRNTGTGNRSRSRSTRGSCTGTQIDVTAAHTAGALLTHGAVRSWWAVRCHLPAADAYAYPPKVNISWFTCVLWICVCHALKKHSSE